MKISSDGDDGGVWEDDTEYNETGGHRNELEREWYARREEFRNAGYREGVEAGKHETIQEGFDQGYESGVFIGYQWGVLRGALATLQAGVVKGCVTDHTALEIAHGTMNRLRLEDVQSDEFSASFPLNEKSCHRGDGDEEACRKEVGANERSCNSMEGSTSVMQRTKRELQKVIEDSGFRIQESEKE